MNGEIDNRPVTVQEDPGEYDHYRYDPGIHHSRNCGLRHHEQHREKPYIPDTGGQWHYRLNCPKTAKREFIAGDHDIRTIAGWIRRWSR